MRLSVVTSVYKSSATIESFYQGIISVLGRLKISDYEIIVVNDGSPDDSLAILLSLKQHDPRLKIIDFSRNFGHHYALLAGIREAKGEFLFLIDSDLEESPDLLETFYSKMMENDDTDVCFGVQKRRKEPWLRKTLSQLYYRFFLKMVSVYYPKDVLTVRIMNRNYANALLQYKEKHLELFAVFALAGFQQTPIIVDKPYKGTTTYSPIKLLSMAVDSITSLTVKPLYFVFFMAVIYWLICMPVLGLLFMCPGDWITTDQIWIFIAVTCGALLSMSVAVTGIYFSKLMIEMKDRPGYIIKKIYK